MRSEEMRGVAGTTVIALKSCPHMAPSGYGSVHSFIRKQWTHLSCNGFSPVQPHQTDAAAAASRPSIPIDPPDTLVWRGNGPLPHTHTRQLHCGSCLWSGHLCQVGQRAKLACSGCTDALKHVKQECTIQNQFTWNYSAFDNRQDQLI